MARIMLRPIGSPLALGFVALGAGSISLSGVQLAWLPSVQTHQVALVLLLFVAPLELMASVFGFLARDSVGGTGMGTLAGTWVVSGALIATSPPASTSRVLGLLLCFVAAALLVPAIAAASGKVLASVVMTGAAGRFVLTAVYELTNSHSWEQVSGWWGVALCVVALYAAAAFEVEDTRRATVLPVGRRGAGRRAVEGSLADAVDRIQHEAGVREQL